ncbi:MAG: hypothetical protein FJ291_11120 [Planctomycetes bacterium]|nr:hypothetical protein [Planctomycetota bacterium]
MARLALALAARTLALMAAASGAQAAEPKAPPPGEAVGGTGVSAGLCVLVGGDPARASALCGQGRMLVHVLALDDAACAEARRRLADAGLYGVASAAVWRERGGLPYADNLVNLLVADCEALGQAAPAEAEVLRILVPGRGAAWLKRDGRWAALRKPMPKTLDGWEQYWYDATGNPVSRDEAVKPGTGLQWIAGSMEIADDNGYRLSGGRLIYKRRVGGASLPRDSAAQLVCRDAFNGLPCWVRDVTRTDHFNRPLMGKLTPLVFTANRIYTVLGAEGQPIVAIDADTGETVRTYDQAGTTFTRNSPRSEPLRKAKFFSDNYGRGNLAAHDSLLIHTVGNELFVVDAATGARKWHFKGDDYLLIQKPTVNPDDAELYAVGCNKEAERSWGGGRNPGQRAAAVLAFDLRTGARKWTTPIDDRHVTHAVYGERTLVVYSAQDNGPREEEWIFGAIDTASGKFRWRHAWSREKPLWQMQRREAVIRGGRLYLLSHGVSVFGLKSGEPLRHFVGGNSRCETSKATANYLLMAFSQFIDYRAEPPRAIRVGLSRGSCGSGFFPAYGMVHYLPNMCNCDNWVRFHVTASSEPVREPLPDAQRLIRGPAFAEIRNPKSEIRNGEDWPMFLQGPQRGAWTASALPAKLAPVWNTAIQPPPGLPPLPRGEGGGEGASLPPLPRGEGGGEGASLPPLPRGEGGGEGASLPPLPRGEGGGEGASLPPLPRGEGGGEGASLPPLPRGEGGVRVPGAAATALTLPSPQGRGIIAADWLDTNDYIGPVSAPVVAGGLAVAAVREQHRIEALDAATGAKKWSFTAGGRVVTPPTLYGGLCLFGCRDGWVYALRADTGRLAWRFLAAPYERNIVAFSQVESSWPLLGSLLIHDGLAIAVAGYHPMANGGIHVWALDPHTGAIKWHKTLSRTPQWVDISQPRARIDQPHPTARSVGGFEANTVVSNLAYGDGAYIRFSGAALAAKTGELFDPPADKGKGLQGLYAMGPGPTRFLINSDKYPQFRRHYSTEGYLGPYASGSQIIATFPEAREAIPCVGCAFAGADAVVLQGNKGEGVLRRYDTRKLASRDAARSDDTPAWSRVIDGDFRAQQKGQKLYHYSSLIVAGDSVVVAGRIKGRAHQPDPVPGMRQVAEGVLKTFDLRTGEPRQAIELAAAPVVSGLAAAGGRLYVTCEDGSLRCLGPAQ